MGYPRNSGKFNIGPWPKGINNVKDEAHLDDDELRDSENFVFDDQGVGETRPGLIQRVAGTTAQGLYHVTDKYAVYFDAGKLYKLNVKDWSKTELASGYSTGKRISWERIGSRIFFTNGSEHGRIHVPTWEVLSGFGTQNPGLNVALSTLAYGSLCAGRYFISISYVDSFGEESGCPNLSYIELENDGGINIELTGTVPASIDRIRVYATDANGSRDELFRIAELDATDTEWNFLRSEFGSPIETLFLNEIPVPDLIGMYNGFLYFAIGNTVWHSETMRYGLYHIDHNELGTYPEEVSVLERGVDSIWVVADKTYAYVGKHPKDFELKDNVFNHSAVKFSGMQVEGNLFEKAGARDVPFWFSSRGAVVGLQEGQVLPVMKDRAEPDKYGIGASGTVEFDGVKSVVTALDEYKSPNDSIGLQDSFSVTVVNRGITELS